MNPNILVFFLLIIYSQSIQTNYLGHFYMIRNKNVPFNNFSLPNFKIFKTSKIICSKRCLENNFCEFLIYHNGYCSLHTEYALERLQAINLNIVCGKLIIE